jgi:branched-chain amino acid transport system permease protein
MRGRYLRAGAWILAAAFVIELDRIVGLGTYWAHIAVLAAIFTILAASLNLFIGYSGLMSLGHTAFFGIGAYATSLLTVRAGWPVIAGIGAAMIAAGAGAFLVSIVALRLRGASFVIATLAAAEVLRIVANNGQKAFGGPAGIVGVPPLRLTGTDLVGPEQVYPVVAAIAIAVVVIVHRLAHSRLGMELVAMRDHEPLAQVVGIDPLIAARRAFVISGLMAGLAGALYAHYVGFISPEVFAFSMMINILVMVVAGGLGTTAGPLIGAVAFTVLPEEARLSDQWRLVVYGAILLAIVRFAPRGLWGTLTSLRLPWRRQAAQAG